MQIAFGVRHWQSPNEAEFEDGASDRGFPALAQHDRGLEAKLAMAGKKAGSNTSAAVRRELIRQITKNQLVAVGKLAEAQSYSPARQLLMDPRLGLAIAPDNIVVDAPVPFGRERPDIQIWLDDVPVQLRNESEHLFAILELKSATKVRDGGRTIAKNELGTYSYHKLRHFYLADAEVIQRYDLSGGDLPQPRQVRWEDLEEDALFLDFFSPLTSARRTLKGQLQHFASNDIPSGRAIADLKDRKRFVDAIITTARILSAAIDDLVTNQLVPDLQRASAEIAKVAADYGAATFQFDQPDPVQFSAEPDIKARAKHAAFNETYTALLSAIEEQMYALHAEHAELKAYAERSGLDTAHATFGDVGSSKKAKDTAASARASYVQETATLLFSRLLMIRFSEDFALLPRILSNGGLSKYARFVDQVGDRFQSLVQTAYRRAKPIYRHLFEQKPLDWLLYSTDENLSDALLHVMWILAGWDFTTVRGDILSGIYDRNLDATQRATLGEVYTRPELAAYMLEACGYDGTQSLLDPACGSGTFLVEAFEAARRRKEAAGVEFGADDVVETLRSLHGMDLNGFSATLAQIQLLWHVLSAVQGKDQVDAMRRAITNLSVEGGHSSLETWGISSAKDLFDGNIGQAHEENVATARASGRRLRNSDRRFRDLSSRQGGYQIVAGNPPFVRVRRLRLTAGQEAEYRELRRKQTDLSVLFAYRAIEWWVAPGGRVGFFLPLALSESAYAEPLRAILSRYKVVEIIDLEEVGNAAFHGANVVTMGLVVEKNNSGEDDVVKVTRVTADSLDRETGRIDMSKAVSDHVPLGQMQLSRYLPNPASQASTEMSLEALPDGDDTEGGAEEDAGGKAPTSDTAWLTKLRAADVPILDKLSAARRLDDLILRGWRRLGKGGSKFVGEIPAGANPNGWLRVPVKGYGVKVGGKVPEVADSRPLYKAKHVPPDGTLTTAPCGHWDGDPELVDTVRFYAWDKVGDPSNTYAIRNIATQPVFAPHPPNAYLTNTVYCVRLSERFPLNVWSVSHVVAWFMVMTARTSVVQGFFTTFYPRQTVRMPVPAAITDKLLHELDALGKRMFTADGELARGDEMIDAIADGQGSRPLRNRIDLIEAGKVSRPADVSWPSPSADWSDVLLQVDGDALVFTGKNEMGQSVPAPTVTGTPCRIEAADTDLLAWIAWQAEARLGQDRLPDRKWFQNLSIPDDPAAAAALVRRRRENAGLAELSAAVGALDELVARELGLTSEQLGHILTAFETDALLRTVAPHWRYRVKRGLAGT